jgi:LemA protein
MKKFIIPIVIVGIIAVWAFSSGKSFYNTAILLKEDATAQWGKVESAYQRRADLIPNLVEVVKGYAKHEKETLEAVIKARASATQTTVNAGDLTPEKMAQFQKAQQGLSGALSRLLVSIEKYPELKADARFAELQTELSRTENRIKIERDRFNDAVKPYNNHIKTFPNNMFAKWFNMLPLDYFKSEEGSEKAPKVKF